MERATLIYRWLWDARTITSGPSYFDADEGSVSLLIPDAILEGARRGELGPASRIEVVVSYDRRRHQRRREDRGE